MCFITPCQLLSIAFEHDFEHMFQMSVTLLLFGVLETTAFSFGLYLYLSVIGVDTTFCTTLRY